MKTKLIVTTTVATACLLAALAGTARADDAKTLWEKTCASCHGKDGKGETTMGKKVEVKDYTDAKVQAGFADDKAVKSIKEGIKDDKGKVRMKAYGELLSDDDVKGLVAYIRTFKK
jgi:cytochrome c553